MAKQRKTRKEKMLHDKRLVTPQEVSSSQPESRIFTYNTTANTTSSTPTAAPVEYAYLTHDLLKTTLLTISIIVVEILLASVIKL